MPSSLHVRRNLVAKRAELLGRMQRLTNDLQRATSPLSQDFEDQAIERENDEVLERLRDSTQQEIDRIDRALQRLAQGTYETCAKCGRSIEATRHAAYPEAETCVTCAANEPQNTSD